MRESGASTYLRNISQDIIDVLRIHFPQNYREIFTLAICRLVHQSPLKNIEFLYENFMLSVEFRGLDLSKNRLTTLIQELGNNKESTAAFMQTFVQNTENIVFDITHLVLQSNKMQLNQKRVSFYRLL